MTPRRLSTLLLAGPLAFALLPPPAAAQAAASHPLLRVKEFHGSLTVTESGTMTGSAPVPGGNGTVTTTLSVSNSCSGTFHITGSRGNAFGEARISCTVGQQFAYEQSSSGTTFRHGSDTSGGGSDVMGASLTIDPERGTYDFEVGGPYVPVTVREYMNGGSSTRETTVQGFGNEWRSRLVEEQALPAEGRLLSGSITERTGYGMGLIVGQPSGAVMRTITWTISPGRPDPDERDIRVAIDGPSCACFDAEAESRPFRFTASASEGGGTFSPFTVMPSGNPPRIVTNRGESSPRLELAATRETGAVTLTIAYTKNGRRFTSAPFRVSFCAIGKPELAGSADVVFDAGTPGRAEVHASARAWRDGTDASDDLVWSLEDIGVARVPESATGAEASLAYEGLPEWNAAFGRRSLTAAIQDGVCDCERTAAYRLFFAPSARNHPRADDAPGSLYGGAPNWFYYWNQTAAARGVNLGVVRHARTLPGSGREDDLPQGRYVDAEDRIYVTDAILTHNCRGRVTREGRKPTGQQASGIDCYAEILRHEGQHRTESHQWWPRDSLNPAVVLNSPVLDPDLDYVPSRVEATRPGCSASSAYSCDERPFTDVTDREIDAYYVGWEWALGQADEEDWSCGGRQWPGGACP